MTSDGAVEMNPDAEAIVVSPDMVASQSKGQSKVSQIIKQLIAFGLAAGCVAFAFRGINLAQLWASIEKINLVWIAALVVSILISHWLRAVRWVIMLQPLSEKKISTWNAFCAVMYAYAVNIPIPRGGEVARVVAISKSESIPWVGVLPTMLIDRLLDIALLVGCVGLTLAILPPELRTNVGYLVPAGVAMCVATVVGLALLPRAADIIRACVGLSFVKDKLPENLREKLLTLAGQFENGTQSLTKPMNLVFIGLLSFAIWGFYFVNFYVTLEAFALMSKLDAARSIIAWTIASVSVIAPSPGCVGTYHVACSEALNMVAGIARTQALAMATVVHAISFVIVPVVVAAICFVIQSIRKRS